MRRITLILALILCTSTLAHAWGVKGHKTVAQISLSFLSDGAREEIENLLGSVDKYVEASIWADQIRFMRPETAPWHFVDLPFPSGTFDAATLCPNNDCLLPRIDEFAKRMADRSLHARRSRRGAQVGDPSGGRRSPTPACGRRQ